MTNLEHIIENTLDAFSEGYTAEQIMNFIKTDMNFPEQPLTVAQVYEICQYVWCVYLDNGNELKKNNPSEPMTNAEKLAKDTDAMECMIYAMCATRKSCIGCPVKRTKCMNGMTTKEWLKSEAKPDD